ncbi:MAG: hypothetical protein V2I35_10170 [Desulfocapsaceae bacterium]|jgi:hypothetical protein|nr:hypothetical protein [Desulfocapsaceae bacterium]
MNIYRTLFVTVLLFPLFLIYPAAARANEGLGIGVKAGTLGAGVELSTSVVDNLRLRGGFNYLTYSFDSTISEIDYDFETEFNSISLILDWHPFGNSFYLSGGAYLNNNKISVNGGISDDILDSVPPQLISIVNRASISGDVEFVPIAPYAGLGWRSNNAQSGWGVAFELGVLFQGAPDVTNLQVNGPIDINGIGSVQDFLAEQEKEIEDELDVFQFYPAASLMLIYNF